LLPAEQHTSQQNAGLKQGDGKATGADGEMAMQGVENDQDHVEEEPVSGIKDVLAGEALEKVRAKETCENLLNWMHARGVEAVVGKGPQGPLHVSIQHLMHTRS
jgi:hypothetical protein